MYKKIIDFTKKRMLLTICFGAMFICGFIPEVYAADILVGTPQTQSGETVYTAIVEPGQTYSNVFGVQNANTDYSNHGKVIINEGIVTGTVYGARAVAGDDYVRAYNNEVDITESTIGSVYGGYAFGGNDNAGVYGNKVNINGGNISGYVYGGSADGATISVTGNEVVIKDNAQIGRTVYGGCAFNTKSWLSMLNNKVFIENSTVNGSVYGGYASGYNTASNRNTVHIQQGANIKGSVYGGYALSDNSDAKYNTVIIEGGTVNGRIYGGIGRNASNNTVVVKAGNLTNAALYGYSDGRKSHSANTLELWTADTKIKSAQNFENYFFIISDDIANKEDRYMLKVDDPVDLEGSNVGIVVKNGTVFHVDDKINLIDKIEGTPSLVNLDGNSLSAETLLTKYDFDLSCSNGALTAIATSEGRSMLLKGSDKKNAGQAYLQTKALLEGQAASIAMLGNSNETAMSIALSDAVNGQKLTTFLTTDYGETDYYTDFHLKMRTAGLVAGVAKKFSISSIENLLGIYFESGNAKYSTFDSFDNGPVFGDGNARYYGGGLLLQIKGLHDKGFYFKTLGRVGGIENNWSTDDFFKEKVSYNTYQPYFGVNAGFGYQNKVGNKICYNMYGQFMFTHQNGSNANVKDEKMQFKDIDSKKTGVGLRIAYDGFLSPYIGILWEKEFEAVARGEVNSLNIEASNFNGSSGILDFGLTCRPKDTSKWQLDVAANLCFGVRSEFKGSAILSIDF